VSEKNKRTAKLPQWFNLEKYEGAPNLSEVEWALNLIARGQILSHLHADSEPKEEEIKRVETKISLIKSFGLLSRTHLKDEYKFAKYIYKLEEVEPGFGIVYPLPLSYAVDIYETIKSDLKLRNNLAIVEYKDIFRHLSMGKLQRGDQFWLDWYENYFRKATYEGPYDEYGFAPPICVDLGVTDEMLIEAFRDWLKSARKDKDELNLPEKLSRNLRQKWSDSAILPYIDLRIHEILEQVDIPLHVIGNGIFPATLDIDTTDAVRKTTRKQAIKALTHAHLLLRHALIIESKLEKTE
jgi:hypothetical protein